MALIIIILLIGAVVGYGYWFVQNKVSKIQQVEVDKNEIEILQGLKRSLLTIEILLFLELIVDKIHTV